MQQSMIETNTSKKLSKFLNNEITYSDFVDFFSVFILCLAMVKTGFPEYNISISVVMLTIIVAQILLKRKIRRTIIIKELIPFSIVIILELPLQKLFGSTYYGWASALSAVVIFMMIVVTIFFMMNRSNTQIYWKVITAFALVSSFLVIVQTIAYYLGGIRLDQNTWISNQLFHAWKYQFFRPCGPFSEPSYFAELGLLALYYCLFISLQKTKAVVILMGLILSTSSLGILGGLLLGVLYIININKMMYVRKWKKVLIVVLGMIACIGLVSFVEDSTNPVVQRILSGGSSSVRMNRSFELFNIMNPEKKLIGIGIQNQELYLNANGIVLPSDSYETITVNREFAQTFGYILCTTGILGCIAFWLPLIRTALKKNYRLKAFLILFFFVCVTCCIFSRATFITYLLMFLVIRDMNSEWLKNE